LRLTVQTIGEKNLMLLILTTPLCLLLILSPFDYCYIECNEDDLSYNVYLGVNTTQLT